MSPERSNLVTEARARTQAALSWVDSEAFGATATVVNFYSSFNWPAINWTAPMLDGAVAPYSIATLSGATFEDLVVQGRGLIAVEFMSYSCSYCAALEPFMQQAAGELKGRVTVFRVNTGTDKDLADIFGIEGTPTIIRFMDGTETGRSQGIKPNLASVIDALTQQQEA